MRTTTGIEQINPYMIVFKYSDGGEEIFVVKKDSKGVKLIRLIDVELKNKINYSLYKKWCNEKRINTKRQEKGR